MKVSFDESLTQHDKLTWLSEIKIIFLPTELNWKRLIDFLSRSVFSEADIAREKQQ